MKPTKDGRYRWDTRKQGPAQRPFRIWDAGKKCNVPHRNFAHERSALDAVLCEVKWSKVGTALEVYDCRTGRLLGQYVRRVNDIHIVEG